MAVITFDTTVTCGYISELGETPTKITVDNIRKRVRRKPGLISCCRFNASNGSRGKNPRNHPFFNTVRFLFSFCFLKRITKKNNTIF